MAKKSEASVGTHKETISGLSFDKIVSKAHDEARNPDTENDGALLTEILDFKDVSNRIPNEFFTDLNKLGIATTMAITETKDHKAEAKMRFRFSPLSNGVLDWENRTFDQIEDSQTTALFRGTGVSSVFKVPVLDGFTMPDNFPVIAPDGSRHLAKDVREDMLFGDIYAVVIKKDRMQRNILTFISRYGMLPKVGTGKK